MGAEADHGCQKVWLGAPEAAEQESRLGVLGLAQPVEGPQGMKASGHVPALAKEVVFARRDVRLPAQRLLLLGSAKEKACQLPGEARDAGQGGKGREGRRAVHLGATPEAGKTVRIAVQEQRQSPQVVRLPVLFGLG